MSLLKGGEIVLDVENISFSYNNVSFLEDISFSAKKGQFVGILGPNGSGKSTLIKLLSGYLKWFSGDIKINGKSILEFSSKDRATKISVLSQESTNNINFTSEEVVSLGRYAHQSGFWNYLTEEDYSIINNSLNATNSFKFKNRYLSELSGGEKQRIFLSQILAQSSDIILLDEPSNHLDLKIQANVLKKIKDHAQLHSKTIISVFHDVNVASIFCDKIIYLNNGKLIDTGEDSEKISTEKLLKVYEIEFIETIINGRNLYFPSSFFI
ncbi:MAG: iron transporter ATPase [Bacillales bacterium]|jgi:iron complex transport system ATP-binding protein|nr:iron transporter ATPase [Bacillales bacterium]